MKVLINLFTSIYMLLIITACNEGIDPISPVDPGPDMQAPAVEISYPLEGTKIRVKENITSLNVQFEVTDDIEIQSIALILDGSEIKSFDNFKDYRRALGAYQHTNLTNGSHTLTITATDLSGKNTSQSVTFEKIEPYQPVYEGEIFYMPFDGDYVELINITEASKVGTPAFADDAVSGKAYAGAASAYLTFPTGGLSLGDEFSAVFWHKVNAVPDRSGLLTIGPPDPANPSAPNNRKNGFRFFREVVGGHQVVKLNVGTGSSDSWFDGGVGAAIDNTPGEWVHLAFTISADKVTVYVNGEVVSQGSFPGVDWTGCDILSIASGAPRFTEWGHLSDASLYDELRLFNKALTQEEIQMIISN